MVANSPTSFYQPGETLLHHVDSRLKVCACLLVVAQTFAADGWIQFMLPALAILLSLSIVAPLPRPVWRTFWMLRWFLLFTLLMYLLFSQGRTLMGVSWLSLDGLLRGVFVCAQMLLAVLSAMLLSVTTSIEELVGAFGWFAKPLQWLGCKTDEWQQILLLTVGFVSVVGEEVKEVPSRMNGSYEDRAKAPAGRRNEKRADMLRTFVQRMVERGDTAAHFVASGSGLYQQPAEPSALFPLAFHDKLFALSILLVTAGYVAI